MRQTPNLARPSQHESALLSLVELFPNATPLRIPILLGVTRGRSHLLEENAIIVFGTSEMIFFESRIPLELADRLHLRNSDGSLETEAIVVAVRVNDHQRAVAARFVAEVHNWIVQD